MLDHPLIKDIAPHSMRCILADPPWDFRGNSKKNPGRNARRYYSCMSLADIEALPISQMAADDCILWMWITGPMLAIGAHLPIMKAWGFKPSGMGFVWIKLNPRAPQMIFMLRDIATGPGLTTRKNAEFCLIGKRGRSVRMDAGVHEVIISPRREHSRKPDETHERIERYCDGPRLELFGRQQRPGWIVRGNESSKFIEEDHGAETGTVPLVQPNDDPQPQTIAADAGPLADSAVQGRNDGGSELHRLQSNQGGNDSGGMERISPSSSALLARLRQGLRPMVLPRVTPGEVEG